MTSQPYRNTDPHAERKRDEYLAAKAEREAMLARKALSTAGRRILYAVAS